MRYLRALFPCLALPALPIGAVAALVMWFTGRDLAKLELLRRDGTVAEARLVDARRHEKRLTAGVTVGAATLRFEYRVAGVAYTVEKDYTAGDIPAMTVAVLHSTAHPEVCLVRSHPIGDEELNRSRYWYWAGPKMGLAIYAAVLVLVITPTTILPGILALGRRR
jgi:hypothetical protein